MKTSMEKGLLFTKTLVIIIEISLKIRGEFKVEIRRGLLFQRVPELLRKVCKTRKAGM